MAFTDPTSDIPPFTTEVIPETPEAPSMFGPLPPVIPKPEEVSLRAQKFDYALGDKSPGLETIHNEILAGQERSLREKAVAVGISDAVQRRQKQIMGVIEQAQKEGRPLSKENISTLAELNSSELPLHESLDPATYLEKRYAERLVNEATKDIETELSPEDTQIKNSLANYIARKEGMQNILEETKAKYDGEGIFTKVINNATAMLVPGVMWYRTRNIVDGAPTSSVLQGNNILEQVSYLHSLPPDSAVSAFRNAVDDLYKKNPAIAVEFAQYALSYTGSDQFLGNLSSVLDVASLGLAAPIRRAASGAAKGVVGVLTPSFISTVGKAAGSTSTSIPGVLNASGQVAEAGFRLAVQRFRDAASTTSGARAASTADLMKDIPSLFNPQHVLNDAGNTQFANTFANRLQDLLLNQSRALIDKGIMDPINITRIEPGTAAYQEMLDTTTRLFNVEYPQLSNSVLSVTPVRSIDNALTNTDFIAVKVARPSGTLFESVSEAMNFAEHTGLKNVKIKTQGSKFYIEMTKTMDESLLSVRNSLGIDTQGVPTPQSMANRFLGFLRTADDLLPNNINQERKIAASGASQLTGIVRSVIESAVKPLGSIKAQSRKDFLTFLEAQRDTVTNGVRGVHSETIGQFESDWLARFNRMPTEQEATAYFTFKQVNDLEWTINNLSILKGKQRLGFENFHFKKDGVSFKGPPAIEGKIHETIPWDKQGDAGIMVWNDTASGAPEYLRKQFILGDTRRQRLDDLVANEGYKVIELSQYGEDALRQFPGVEFPRGHIKYVLVKKYESSPLNLKQIPYRPGGHVQHLDEFFISQPRVRAHREFSGQATVHDYTGDVTILSARTQDQAIRHARVLEEARNLLFVKKDVQQARAYVAQHLPFSWKDFRDMWNDTKTGELDPNTPIYWRRASNSVEQQHGISKNYANFNDTNNSPHNSFNEDVNMRFAQERNGPLNSIINTGSDQAPLWNLHPARLMDPVSSMQSAMSTVLRGKYFDDLKVKSAERFVAEFGHFLEGDADMLRRYPLNTMMKAQFKKGTDPAVLAAGKNYRRAQMEFMHLKDEDQKVLDWVENSMVSNFGDVKGAKMYDDWARPVVEASPLEWSRITLARVKLGFWNPKQLFLQGLGVVNAGAIEGFDKAGRGWAVGRLMHGLHLDASDANLLHNAKLATNFGMSERHFMESYQALQKTGFQTIGGDFADVDDIINPKVIRGAVSSTLDSASYFFKMGEKINRLTAWNTAYLSWREANPVAKFGDEAIKVVRDRADLLTINMTNASNAGWNNNKLARIPTQFFSYHGRLADLMWGNRLSAAEKRRLVLVNSLMYGVPTGVGGTALGAFVEPLKLTKQYLMESGVDVDNTAMDVFLHGLPQVAMGAVIGEDSAPNFSETFGPNGLSFLRDIITPDSPKSFVQTLLGAQGTFAKNTMEAVSGFGTALLATMREDEEYLPLTKEDFLPVLQDVSTAGNAIKAYYAYTANKYLTKNGKDVIVGGASGTDAFLTLFTGMVPQDVNDSFNKKEYINSVKDGQKDARTKAIIFLRLAANPDNSTEDTITYHKKAKAYMLGLLPSQKVDIIREAARGREELFVRSDNKIRELDQEHFNRYIEKLKK